MIRPRAIRDAEAQVLAMRTVATVGFNNLISTLPRASTAEALDEKMQEVKAQSAMFNRSAKPAESKPTMPTMGGCCAAGGVAVLVALGLRRWSVW